MVQNNKILTVSYGTFSCTLEGFEDSFETMKAIAEYFRDLAADDRFFGAEPPQPDTEMMARIAEREIARQVRASRDGGGIVLRASDYQVPAAVAAAATAAQQPVAEAPRAPAVKPEEAAEPEPEIAEPEDQIAAKPEPADLAEAAAPTVEESATDDLAAIRGFVAASGQDQAADEQDAEPVAKVEPEVEVEAEPEVEVEVETFTAEVVTETEQADAADEEEPAVDPAPRLAAESIAAKLQRIRAVVSQNAAAAEAAEAAADHSEDYEDASDAEAYVSSAVADITAGLDADDAAYEDAEDGDYDDSADDLAAAFARFEASTDEVETGNFDETYEDDGSAEPGDVLAVLAAMREDQVEPEQGDEDTAQSDDLGDADELLTEEAGMDAEVEQFTGGDAADAPVEAENIEATEAEEDDFAPEAELFARLDDADDDENDDEISNLMDDASDAENSDSSLSAEDEADLMRELAEVVAASKAAEDDDADSAGFAPEGTDEDVSRLMAAAEEKMEAVESTTTRNTYNHLRAAMAAAEAERSAGQVVTEEDGDTAYRNDLASVVHPRRSLGDGARIGRPERPAPLKLVAEQRVDLEKPEVPSEPVQPRRVQVTEKAVESDEGGFAKFASEAGATELPELLEAAAAYLSFVEGHDQFSRPQLMNKVRQLGMPEFNREDGLRSFGQLLREGKIEKAGGGRFTASGDIGFRPDERAAG